MSKANHAPNTSERAAPKPHTYVHYDINTAAGLVEALGREDAVAKQFDITPRAVRDWEISGHIPTGWHLRLFARVCALDKTISPSVFGLRYDDAAAVALSDLMMAARFPDEGGANG